MKDSPLLNQAIELHASYNALSAPLLQRKLKVGYKLALQLIIAVGAGTSSTGSHCINKAELPNGEMLMKEQPR